MSEHDKRLGEASGAYFQHVKQCGQCYEALFEGRSGGRQLCPDGRRELAHCRAAVDQVRHEVRDNKTLA